MQVRIQIDSASPRRKARSFNWQLVRGTAALLGPASLMAFALGCWRLGADLNLTGQFAISRGLFSHWQVWLALGAGMQVAATILSRYANRRYSSSDAAAL